MGLPAQAGPHRDRLGAHRGVRVRPTDRVHTVFHIIAFMHGMALRFKTIRFNFSLDLLCISIDGQHSFAYPMAHGQSLVKF